MRQQKITPRKMGPHERLLRKQAKWIFRSAERQSPDEISNTSFSSGGLGFCARLPASQIFVNFLGCVEWDEIKLSPSLIQRNSEISLINNENDTVWLGFYWLKTFCSD